MGSKRPFKTHPWNHKQNHYEVVCDPVGAYVIVELTQGQWATCDVSDWFGFLNQYKWSAVLDKSSREFYVYTNELRVTGRNKTVLMHRLIFGLTDRKIEVDHKNHCPLENRRFNLRVCSREKNAQNVKKYSRNTSGYIGVNWCKKRNRWRSRISIDGRLVELGFFESKESAAKIRDVAAIAHRGEFAELNHVD